MFHAIVMDSEAIALKTACFCFFLGRVVLQIFQLRFKFMRRSRLASITTIYAMCKISC